MGKLVWDQSGKHVFEYGVSNGVLFPMSDVVGTYGKGVAWNGLTKVSQKPTGATVTPIYADGQKYLNLMSAEEFEGTIEALMYPDEFAECDGSAAIAPGVMIGQQTRKTFAFCYKTMIGNDLNPNAGYKLHIIYGCTVTPTEKGYGTVNESPEAVSFSWDVKSIPVSVAGFKPTSIIELDSTVIGPVKMALVEDKLYGKDAEPASEATLLLPDAIAALVGTGG